MVYNYTIERRKHQHLIFGWSSHMFSPGSVLYLQNGAEGRDPNGGWVSEMCLWTPWAHVGDLVSANFSRVLAIHVKDRSTLGPPGDPHPHLEMASLFIPIFFDHRPTKKKPPFLAGFPLAIFEYRRVTNPDALLTAAEIGGMTRD